MTKRYLMEREATFPRWNRANITENVQTSHPVILEGFKILPKVKEFY